MTTEGYTSYFECPAVTLAKCGSRGLTEMTIDTTSTWANWRRWPLAQPQFKRLVVETL